MEKYKLIYIAGSGRSGSTLLAALLSEADDCVCVGEPVLLWSSVNYINLCSCEKAFSDCDMWRRVLREHFSVESFSEISVPLQGKFVRVYQTLLILFGINGFISQEYLDVLKKLYMAIYEVSGARVVIDESKFLPYLYALTKTGIFDLYVIHLVRDPRAVAFSWQRLKIQGTKYMPRYPWYIASRFWLAQQFFYFISHGFVPKDKYIKICYEDFVEEPETWLKKILTSTGLKGQPTFVSSHQFKISRENHLIISNPSVPKQGLNTIRNDIEWQEKMPLWVKAAVTFICWPMMLIYRYPLFSDVIYRREKSERLGKLK